MIHSSLSTVKTITTNLSSVSPANWNIEQVIQWAHQINLPVTTRDALEENEVDGSLLLTLSKADLKDELSVNSLSVRRYLWDEIEQLRSQHKVFDFQSAVEIHAEEIEKLKADSASSFEENIWDPEVMKTIRDDLDEQRRVIDDNAVARQIQGISNFVLQTYEDVELANETQERYDMDRLQEEYDHAYAMDFASSDPTMARNNRRRQDDPTEEVVKSLMALSIDCCVKNKINVAEALTQDIVTLPHLGEEWEDRKSSATTNNKAADKEYGISLEGIKLPPITCSVCYNQNVPGYDLPCEHANCVDCMIKLLKVALNDSSLLPLRCCELPIDMNISKTCLSPEDSEKLLSRLVEIEATKKMYCPQCTAFINLDFVDDSEACVLECSCGASLCTSCHSLHHPSMSCEENKAILDKSSNDSLVLDMATEEKWQRCPGCSILVELVSGCNHITCSNCKSEFCYRCGSAWKKNKCSMGCAVWEEANLLERGEERVRAREIERGREFRPAERQQFVARAMRAAVANEDCWHEWEKRNGYQGECERCGYELYAYGMVCAGGCGSTVCYTCAQHHIPHQGWR